MPYIALRRIKVGDDLYREIGEHVPEADSWRQIRPWIGTHIQHFDTLPAGVSENTEAVAEPSTTPEPTVAAQAEAEATGVDVDAVDGTGVDGRVTKPDVVAAAEAADEPTEENTAPDSPKAKSAKSAKSAK